MKPILILSEIFSRKTGENCQFYVQFENGNTPKSHCAHIIVHMNCWKQYLCVQKIGRYESESFCSMLFLKDGKTGLLGGHIKNASNIQTFEIQHYKNDLPPFFWHNLQICYGLDAIPVPVVDRLLSPLHPLPVNNVKTLTLVYWK